MAKSTTLNPIALAWLEKSLKLPPKTKIILPTEDGFQQRNLLRNLEAVKKRYAGHFPEEGERIIFTKIIFQGKQCIQIQRIEPI